MLQHGDLTATAPGGYEPGVIGRFISYDCVLRYIYRREIPIPP